MRFSWKSGLAAVNVALAAPCGAQVICGEWSSFPGPETGGPPGQTATTVNCLANWDDGAGPALYAGGVFTGASSAVRDIAKWNGSSWDALGQGLDREVRSLLPTVENGVPVLYACGAFLQSGTQRVKVLGRWNGQAWSEIAPDWSEGIPATMAIYDDGGGPALYVGGTSLHISGLPFTSLLMWRAGVWQVVAGAPAGPDIESGVYDLAVHDDGSGPALYVAGSFSTAGGAPAGNIARLRGGQWSTLGLGLTTTSQVSPGRAGAMAVGDDGLGSALHAGGLFFRADGRPTVCAATWRETGWATCPVLGGVLVNSSTTTSWTAAVMRYASTPTLLVGNAIFNITPTGQPTLHGGLLAYASGRWWETKVGGTGSARALLKEEDSPAGASVIVGGHLGPFEQEAPTMAKWTACRPCYADCERGGVAPALNVNDFVCYLNRFASGQPYADCDHSSTLNVNDFVCFQSAFAAGCP